MAFLRRYLILAAASLCLPGVLPVRASEGASAGRVFSVLAATDADWAGFGVLEGTEFIPLSPGRQARSPALPFPGGETFVTFGRQVADPATGRLVGVPEARAAWPAGATRALFILVPRPSAARGRASLEVIPCDDDWKTFPPESLRVVNATQATFGGVLGRARMTFRPGESAPVSTTAFIPVSEEAPDPGMPLGLALETPKGTRLLYAASLSVGPRSRVLVVIGPPRKEGSSRVQVRAVRETAPAAAAKP